MNLLHCSAHAWSVVPHDHEEIFRDIPDFGVHLHDFYVREALPVGANLILTFDNEDASLPQDAPRFLTSVAVEIQNRLVVLARSPIPGSVVAVMGFEWLMSVMSCPTWRVHIGRVQYDAVDFSIPIWEVAAVNAILQIGRTKQILAIRNLPPEDALTVGHVRHNAPWRHI